MRGPDDSDRVQYLARTHPAPSLPPFEASRTSVKQKEEPRSCSLLAPLKIFTHPHQ
jgi:hypothetical protein